MSVICFELVEEMALPNKALLQGYFAGRQIEYGSDFKNPLIASS